MTHKTALHSTPRRGFTGWPAAARLLSMMPEVGLILLALVALMPIHAFAVEPERPGQEAFLIRAIFAGGRLWTLSDAGVLSSVAKGEDAWVRENLPEPVFDLCLQGEDLVAITGKRDGGGTWMLHHRVGSTWSVEATVAREAEYLVGLACATDRITLLTSRRFVDVHNDEQHSVDLIGEFRPGLVSSLVYGTSDRLFVGVNNGEWGGGLLRIDRHSGIVTAIERNVTGELCGGPLNSSCDPVNGIASAPWKSDCIVVAVGLVHFMPRGRIVEVCGDEVKRLYFRPSERSTSSSQATQDEEPFGTVAFFGLTHAGNTLWAVGTDGIYAFEEEDMVRFDPFPEFEEIEGVVVSFDLPDFILVLTNVNQRRSVSGSVPMIIPR